MVVSNIRDIPKSDPNVLAWFANQWIGDLYISVMTIRELLYGAYLQRDAAFQAELLAWIENRILRGFGSQVLSIDVGTMRAHATLRLPDTDVSADSLIAATALGRQLIMVTRNTGHFTPFGVRTFNPWDNAPR